MAEIFGTQVRASSAALIAHTWQYSWLASLIVPPRGLICTRIHRRVARRPLRSRAMMSSTDINSGGVLSFILPSTHTHKSRVGPPTLHELDDV